MFIAIAVFYWKNAVDRVYRIGLRFPSAAIRTLVRVQYNIHLKDKTY